MSAPGRSGRSSGKGEKGVGGREGADLGRAARTCGRTRGGRDLSEKGSRAGRGGARGEAPEAGGRAGRGMLRTRAAPEERLRLSALRLQDSGRTQARTEEHGARQSRS